MTGLASALIPAWIFLHPLPFPAGARFWMLLPLVACVAVVYRATRVRAAREMPRATVTSFLSIVVGMSAIAGAFYGAHLLARRFC